MKLKAGGKAIVIALIVGGVGFALNMSGVLDKKPQAEVVNVEPASAEMPKEVPQRQAVETQVEEAPAEPAPQPQQPTAAKNRGLSAVLGQGQK